MTNRKPPGAGAVDAPRPARSRSELLNAVRRARAHGELMLSELGNEGLKCMPGGLGELDDLELLELEQLLEDLRSIELELEDE